MTDPSKTPGAVAAGSTEPARWVRELAVLMDSRFRVPGTSIRFGLDPIIGLLPVLGDGATAFIGLFMLREAQRMRVGKRIKAKMVVNLMVDWLVGLVPGLDLVLDTAVKAHTRNAKLLEHAATQAQRSNSASGDRPESKSTVQGAHT